MMEDPITILMVGISHLTSVARRMQFDTVAVEVDALFGHGGAGEAAGTATADAQVVLVGGERPGGVTGDFESVWCGGN